MINVASNQILPPQITGYKEINPYASPNSTGDPAKCKSMLAAAGYPNGLTLTLVYAEQPADTLHVATALQSDFAMGGVTLKLLEQPSQGEYFDYIETPSNRAHWDIVSRLVVPRLGRKRRAVDLRPASRREPLHQRLDRLRRLQRSDGQQ